LECGYWRSCGVKYINRGWDRRSSKLKMGGLWKKGKGISCWRTTACRDDYNMCGACLVRTTWKGKEGLVLWHQLWWIDKRRLFLSYSSRRLITCSGASSREKVIYYSKRNEASKYYPQSVTGCVVENY
jgi:hypothetical protein